MIKLITSQGRIVLVPFISTVDHCRQPFPHFCVLCWRLAQFSVSLESCGTLNFIPTPIFGQSFRKQCLFSKMRSCEMLERLLNSHLNTYIHIPVTHWHPQIHGHKQDAHLEEGKAWVIQMLQFCQCFYSEQAKFKLAERANLIGERFRQRHCMGQKKLDTRESRGSRKIEGQAGLPFASPGGWNCHCTASRKKDENPQNLVLAVNIQIC